MHKCTMCGTLKPSSEFWKNNGRCKPCKRSVDKGRVRTNPRSIARNNTESARARKRKWRQNHLDPVKESARRAVRNAIVSGRLVPPDACPKCGANAKRRDGVRAIQAHHANGYERPLDIVWLCASCHRHEHDAALSREVKS